MEFNLADLFENVSDDLFGYFAEIKQGLYDWRAHRYARREKRLRSRLKIIELAGRRQ